MARATSTTQSILSVSNSQPTATTTVTIETSSSNQQQTPIRESLVLKLKRPEKKVSWKEGTVDNELMNKRSSKKCCIFHKEKSFDEDDSDCDDLDDEKDKDNGSHNYEGNENCCHGRSFGD